jgi:integrase
MAMRKSSKQLSGLIKRNEIWWIEKRVKGVPGGRLRESTGTKDFEEAEQYLIFRLNEIRQAVVYSERPVRTFQEAAEKWLTENRAHGSYYHYQYHLSILLPFIGEHTLEQVHDGTLQPFIEFRKQQGRKSKTIAASLEKVRHILNLCARKWRDDTSGLTWLAAAPLIESPDWNDEKKIEPLDWDEQELLFSQLPPHLVQMATFAVNTGQRQSEICVLQWDWEIPVPEINASVFLIPGKFIKNGEDRLVILNKEARAVLGRVEGMHPVRVFNYFHLGTSVFRGRPTPQTSRRGLHCPIYSEGELRPVGRMNNSSWKRACKRAGIHYGVHALKHNFGRRLRAAGVPLETRKVLLGHKNGDITSHYSAAESGELQRAAEKVCEAENRAKPTITVLKRRKGKARSNRGAHKMPTPLSTGTKKQPEI